MPYNETRSRYNFVLWGLAVVALFTWMIVDSETDIIMSPDFLVLLWVTSSPIFLLFTQSFFVVNNYGDHINLFGVIDQKVLPDWFPVGFAGIISVSTAAGYICLMVYHR